MFLQFSPPVRQPKKVLKKEPEPEAVLSLAPFTPNPKLFFENVKVGQTAVERLIIKNPSSQTIQVSTQITVDQEINLRLGWTQKSIAQNDESVLELFWTPKEAGSWRYMLHISGGNRLHRDVPVVLKSVSSAKKQKRTNDVKSKGLPRYVTKKSSPLQNLSKKKSPLRKSTLPNVPNIQIFAPEQKYNGKENKFLPQFNSSFDLPTRRDTYVVTQNVAPIVEKTFDDSLENVAKANLSFERKLESDSFVFTSSMTPMTQCFHPDYCSTEEKSVNSCSLSGRPGVCLFPDKNNTFDINKSPSSKLNNLSTETYIKNNLSAETYTKNNLSSETYTKDVNHIMDLSDRIISDLRTPPSFSQSARLESLTGFSAKTTIEADLWSNAKLKTPLRAIREEPSNLDANYHRTPLKRKTDLTFVTSPIISPKRPNLGESHLTDWTKRHAASIIDPLTAHWLEQQEDNFKRWLNAILAPPTDLDSDARGQPLDFAKLWKECQKKKPEQVPKIVITSSRLNALRKAARALYTSQEIQNVLTKVWATVETNKMSIRSDRDVHLDLAIQADVMSVLLSYNPLWLRLGLETIYRRSIPLKSNSDVVGLTTFLWERFIRDPVLFKKYKSIHTPQYKLAIKKSILKRFLALVYFLDVAKGKKLIPHDPCLFCTNAQIKESREALLRFSRDTLASMGDVTKYLKHFKYVLEHKQSYLDEFDYTVNILGVDLRDGVRLTRLMEKLLLDNSLHTNLRVPAISRLQKIHNMKIVFNSLEKLNYELLYEICPKDIVEGHKEKTLSFLQQIIYKVQTPLMAKSVTIVTHWWRSDPIINKREKLKKIRETKEVAARRIQTWYRQRKEKDLQIRFKAAVLIQSLVRMFLARRRFENLKYCVLFIEKQYLARKLMNLEKERFERLKYAVLVVQRRFRANRLMKIQRNNYIQLKYVVILLQRRFRADRLMQLQRETFFKLKMATLILQRRWRAQLVMRQERDKYQTLRATVIIIQRTFRANLEMQKQRDYYNELKVAVILIQRMWRAKLAMRDAMVSYEAMKNATVIIQRRWKMKKDMENFQELKKAAISIQGRWKATIAMRREMKSFQALKHATIVVQKRYREICIAKLEFNNFQRLKTVTIFVQTHWRATIAMKRQMKTFQEMKKAAISIQRRWKATIAMRKEMKNFQALKHATIVVQKRYREHFIAKLEFNNFQRLKSVTIFVQTQWRATIAMKREMKAFRKMKKAAITIQRRWKATIIMRKEMKNFQALKHATIIVQKRYRETCIAKLEFNNFRRLKTVTIFVQTQWRATIAMKREMKTFQEMKKAAVCIQRKWRAEIAMREETRRFRMLKKSAITVQRRFRCNKLARLESNKFQMLKTAVIFVQRQWRAKLAMVAALRNFQTLKKATVVIQTRYRAILTARSQFNKFHKMKKTTIFVQRKWRAKLAMRTELHKFQILKTVTIMAQRRFRANKVARTELANFRKLKEATIIIQRRWRATIEMRKETRSFQKLKQAVSVIQMRYRAAVAAKLEFDNFRRFKTAVIFIQCKWRAKLAMAEEMKKFQLLKRSAVVIQRRFRANRLSKLESNKFQMLKTLVICVQRKWRAKIAMVAELRNFQTVKNATVVVQRRYRAKLTGRSQFNEFKKLKDVTIFVQRKWRSKLAMRIELRKFQSLKTVTVMTQRRFRRNKLAKMELNNFRKLKEATIIIQRRWRATIDMRKGRERFQQLKQAAFVIQRRFRATVAAKLELYNFRTLKTATIFIQRKWRAMLLMRTEVQRLERLKSATVTVQRRFRANRIAKVEYLNYQKLKQSVLVVQKQWRARILNREQIERFKLEVIAITHVQTYARGFLIRRKYSSFLTPEAITERRLVRLQNKAALKIQTAWRGYKLRLSMTPALLKILEKVKLANRNALPENTLGVRCKKAVLQLSQSGSLTEIETVLTGLDYITRRCKQSLSKYGGILPESLYQTIMNTNRSPSEMIVCTMAASVLINFYRFEPTRKYTWLPKFIEPIVTVMLHACDKESLLFPTLSTLIWFFLHDKEYAKVIICTTKFKEKIAQIKDRCDRKARMVAKVNVNYPSLFIHCPKLSLPAAVPDWGIDFKEKPRIFTNSVQAIQCIVAILNL